MFFLLLLAVNYLRRDKALTSKCYVTASFCFAKYAHGTVHLSMNYSTMGPLRLPLTAVSIQTLLFGLMRLTIGNTIGSSFGHICILYTHEKTLSDCRFLFINVICCSHWTSLGAKTLKWWLLETVLHNKKLYCVNKNVDCTALFGKINISMDAESLCRISF